MGPGPAGLPLIEYLFSRIVCTSVPIGYVVLVVILVIAGIKYLTSGGEAKAIQSAHYTVTWGLLGILFLAISWLILQLIQNFTGIEVTKFTVASLPGVQGFTGSCWSSPPISVTNTNISSNSTKGISGFSFPVHRHLIPCDNPYDYMTPVSIPAANEQRIFDIVTYNRDPFKTTGFDEAVTSPKIINIMDGSIDNSLWSLNYHTGADKKIIDIMTAEIPHDSLKGYANIYLLNEFGARASLVRSRFIAGGGQMTFTKYPKGVIPKNYVEFLHSAQFSIKKYIDQTIYFNEHYYKTTDDLASFDDFKEFDWDSVHLIGFSCPDADFYPANNAVSPLIYFYSPYKVTLKLGIKAVLRSNLPQDNFGFWQLTTYTNGNFKTEQGNHRFIPYEFLRRDFRKPTNGVVVNKENLTNYLKSNLWKKLGLTELEIEDYWQDIGWRIPKSDYYFISLIDRSEIDRVLPMEVNPKPDTIIRNMTYILPIDKPFIPIPIKIIAPDRNGFTVLENGGFIEGF